MARSAKNAHTTPGAARETPIVAVSRAWLIALTALLIVPWLVAGGIYIWGSGEKAAPFPAPSEMDTPAEPGAAGPWGRLTVTPIIISPPIEYVAADWKRSEVSDEWHFPGVTTEMLEAFLLSSGMSRDEIASVKSSARSDPRTHGLIVTPHLELVRKMNPEVRAHLYLQLGKSSLNFDQADAFRFFGASSDAWLTGSLISQRTRQLVEPLIYRDGDYLLFADAELIRSQVRDIEELRRLAKTLLRQATMLVRLSVKEGSDVERLAEYWGRGGRRTDLRPLLESIVCANQDQSIDIVHLLPTFARNHLYRYPKITTADLDRPMLSNCLWTALNFFRDQPEDRFLDGNVALSSLKQDYYIVESGFQLGDIVAFLDAGGNLFHVAVYLAADLVFSKNGTSPVSPWAITTIDRLKGFYRQRAANPRLIYHRRKDF